MAIKGHPKALDSNDSAFTTFWKIFRSYFYRAARKKKLQIEIGGRHYEAITDKDGNFELSIPPIEIENVNFFDAKTGAKLDVLSDRKAVFQNSKANLFVISDIDDTILVSHSARFFSKLWLMLFRPVAKRKTVEESELAYRALKSAQIPFAYVSASEYNLYSLVSTFIDLHKLPEGPIYLRPHQEWRELISPTERSNYKFTRIRRLFEHYESKQFVLFGDDSQQDFSVFSEIALLFPERVHSVYLRKTGILKGDRAHKTTWEMPDGKIPVHYYDSYTEIENQINDLINEVPRRS